MASRSSADQRMRPGLGVVPARPFRMTAAALRVGLVALAVVGAVAAQPPSADVASRLTTQAKRASERLATLQREADALSRTQQSLIVTLRQLEVTRAIAETRAEQADAAARIAAADLASADATVASLDARLAGLQPIVQATIRRLYVNGTAERAAWQVAPTAGEEDAGRALRLLGAVAVRDRAVVAEYEFTRTLLLGERAARHTRAAAAESAADAAAQARALAVQAATAQAARVQAIDQQRDLAERLATELRQAANQLEAEVSRLGAAPRPATVALPIRPFKSTLPWPAAGEVVRTFGPERSSRFGTRVVRQGIELDTPTGTSVTAVHDGQVVFSGPFAGFGQLVIVDHGHAAFSLYGFLDERLVDKGAVVDRGDPVARSGRSPSGREATYFELRIDGRPVNPLEWLIRR